MAVNLLNSSDIEITQTGDDIQLSTTTPISTITSNISTNTSNIQKLFDEEVYSTMEVETNKKWIDGKTIFRKVIDDGTMPNSTVKTVSHNISNLGNVISQTTIITDGSNWYQVPHVGAPNMGNGFTVAIRITSTELIFHSGSNISSYTGTTILEYTKSS